MISRHPSFAPNCQDQHPLHHYTHPFNLTPRWWLEVCMKSVCVHWPLCVRCLSPYANHSLALRINLQMCHYPSGSAAITLQLPNSRLASWAPHMQMYVHTQPNTYTHMSRLYGAGQKISDIKDATFGKMWHSALQNREQHKALFPSDSQKVFSLITAPHLSVNRTTTDVSCALSHSPVS